MTIPIPPRPNKKDLPAGLAKLLAGLKGKIFARLDKHPYEETEIDTRAVLLTAQGMLDKMYASSDAGRSGWHDPTRCSTRMLMTALLEHIAKGDMIDVANFAMMLWQRQQTDDPSYFLGVLYECLDEFIGQQAAPTDPLRLRLSDPPTVVELAQAGEQMTEQVSAQIRQINDVLPKKARLAIRAEPGARDGRTTYMLFHIGVSLDG